MQRSLLIILSVDLNKTQQSCSLVLMTPFKIGTYLQEKLSLVLKYISGYIYVCGFPFCPVLVYQASHLQPYEVFIPTCFMIY